MSHYSLVSLITIIVGLASWPSLGDTQKVDAIVGSYYRGDGLGYNITLHLEDTGLYSATWDGCLGEYGSAHGAWTHHDGVVMLAPDWEDGAMEGHLRELLILQHDGQAVLVPKEDMDSHHRWGANSPAAFRIIDYID